MVFPRALLRYSDELRHLVYGSCNSHSNYLPRNVEARQSVHSIGVNPFVSTVSGAGYQQYLAVWCPPISSIFYSTSALLGALYYS